MGSIFHRIYYHNAIRDIFYLGFAYFNERNSEKLFIVINKMCSNGSLWSSNFIDYSTTSSIVIRILLKWHSRLLVVHNDLQSRVVHLLQDEFLAQDL